MVAAKRLFLSATPCNGVLDWSRVIKMEDTIAINHIQTFPLFRNLEPDELKRINSQLSKETLKKGILQNSENITLNRFHIILSGRLKMFQYNSATDRKFTTYILSAGDVFDVLSLLDGKKHEITIEILDNLEVYTTDIANTRTWLRDYTNFNQNMFSYLAKRIMKLEEQAADIVTTETSYRLAKLLIMNLTNDNTQEGTLINNLSHSELADLIGTTRAVLNRHLQVFKQEGIINIERKSITINDLQKLKQKIEKI